MTRAFLSYMSKIRSMGRLGTYKLARLQALLLSTVSQLCHGRLLHVWPGMLSHKSTFSVAQQFGATLQWLQDINSALITTQETVNTRDGKTS